MSALSNSWKLDGKGSQNVQTGDFECEALATTTTTTVLETTTTAAETTTTTAEVLPSVVTTTTVAETTTTAEVSPATLPFTGPRNGALIPFAVSLLGAGLLVVLGARRIED